MVKRIERHPWVEACRKLVEEAGGTVTEVEHTGGDHIRMRYEHDGRALTTVFANTSSDGRRGLLNQLSDMRHQMGLVGGEKTVGEPKKKGPPKPKTERPIDWGDPIEHGPEPFEELAKMKREAPLIPAPGLYEGIPAEDYHGREICPAPSISSSGLRTIINESPRHYWWQSHMNPDREPFDKQEWQFGRAMHDLLLYDGAEWSDRYYVMADAVNLNSNAGKAEKAEAEAAGKVVLRQKHLDAMQAMAREIEGHPWLGKAFENGKVEATLAWQDEETGVWLRCRPDFLPAGLLFIPDYKTTVSAHPEEFRRQVFNHGYYMQAAHYLEGIEKVCGVRPKSFYFIAQEKKAPHVVSPIALSDVAIKWGAIQNHHAIRTFARCLETGYWPGYTDEVAEVDLPKWAENDLERRHEAGEFEAVPQEEQAA